MLACRSGQFLVLTTARVLIGATQEAGWQFELYLKPERTNFFGFADKAIQNVYVQLKKALFISTDERLQ